MRILLVSEYFPSSGSAELTGGVESRCFAVARELAKRHDVRVIASYQGGPRLEEFEGITVERVGSPHSYSNTGSIPSRLSFALAAAKKGKALERPDIVDGYNFLSYLPAHAIAHHHGAKSVATYHDVWAGGEWLSHKGLLTGMLGEVWERRVLSKRWDRIIAVSAFTKAKLAARGVPAESVEVVHNGINLARLGAVKATKSAHPSVCCVSRLVPYKQVDVLVRAMALVCMQVGGATCRIIGTGGERQRLEQLANELGISKNVEFLGRIERHDDVIAEMKRAWAFAFPSRVEGFGMVAVEAMACGTPHVSSDIPAIAEATGDGRGGFLVAPGSIEEMAGRLVELLRDGRLRQQKAKEGREHAKRFGWPLIVRQVEQVYEGLLN